MPRPASGRLKRDLYERKFEILDLKKEMQEMKIEYKKKQERLKYLTKLEEEQEQRDREEIFRKKKRWKNTYNTTAHNT